MARDGAIPDFGLGSDYGARASRPPQSSQVSAAFRSKKISFVAWDGRHTPGPMVGRSNTVQPGHWDYATHVATDLLSLLVSPPQATPVAPNDLTTVAKSRETRCTKWQ